MRVGNNIQPLCLEVSCLLWEEVFLLRPNGYKLSVSLTCLCVKEKQYFSSIGISNIYNLSLPLVIKVCLSCLSM